MATKTLISLGRHPVNSLQVGQMIRFQSRCFVQEMVLTIRRLQWLKCDCEDSENYWDWTSLDDSCAYHEKKGE